MQCVNIHALALCLPVGSKDAGGKPPGQAHRQPAPGRERKRDGQDAGRPTQGNNMQSQPRTQPRRQTVPKGPPTQHNMAHTRTR